MTPSRIALRFAQALLILLIVHAAGYSYAALAGKRYSAVGMLRGAQDVDAFSLPAYGAALADLVGAGGEPVRNA